MAPQLGGLVDYATSGTEKALDVLQKAACQSLLSRADKGLDTVIGEGGVKVSGGEKQRLSIARALLRQPHLLVFDEATAALDNQTEREVTDAIAKWYSARARPDSGGSFIHGNMRLDNVLEVGKRVAFLDFEHCGAGPFYQDLARPVTHLLQVSAIAPFPRIRIIRCLNAYLKEYGRIHPFDWHELSVYVGARMSRYYLETQNSGMLATRIGGFPVSRSRIGALTTSVLKGGVERAVLGLWR